MEVKYFIVKMLATVSGPARPVVKPIMTKNTGTDRKRKVKVKLHKNIRTN